MNLFHDKDLQGIKLGLKLYIYIKYYVLWLIRTRTSCCDFFGLCSVLQNKNPLNIMFCAYEMTRVGCCGTGRYEIIFLCDRYNLFTCMPWCWLIMYFGIPSFVQVTSKLFLFPFCLNIFFCCNNCSPYFYLMEFVQYVIVYHCYSKIWYVFLSVWYLKDIWIWIELNWILQ